MSILKVKTIFLRIIISVLVAVASIGTAVFCNNAFKEVQEVSSATVPPSNIGSVSDLKALADYVNSGNNCSGLTFRLTADIDFKGATFAGIGLANPYAYTKETNYMFSGNFYGEGFTIKGFKRTETTQNANMGFFGVLGNGAIISRLKLEDVTYVIPSCTRYHFGGIAGRVDEGATVKIEQCQIDGMSIENHGTRLYYGGIIGEVGKNSNIGVKDCSVNIVYFGVQEGVSNYPVASRFDAFVATESTPNCTVKITNCIYIENQDNLDLPSGSPWLEGGLFQTDGNGKFTKMYDTVYINYWEGDTVAEQVQDAFKFFADPTYEYHSYYTQVIDNFDISNIGGETGTIWYYNDDYNDGAVYLRAFMDWQTVTIKGVGALVGLDSLANAKYSQTSIEIPKDADKKYTSTYAKITIYGRNIYSTSTLCHGELVKYEDGRKGWTCISETSYTVTYTPVNRIVYVCGTWYLDGEDYIDSVDILINGQTYDQEYNWYYYKEVPCGRHIYFEYSSPYLKRDENLQKTYYEKLTVYYWPEDGSNKIVIAVYTAKAGYAIRDAGSMFEIITQNEGGKATYKLDSVKAFELHNDVSIAVVLEPMTYNGSIK